MLKLSSRNLCVIGGFNYLILEKNQLYFIIYVLNVYKLVRTISNLLKNIIMLF